MRDFAVLQRRLAPVWRLSRPPGGTEHVRIILPSYNLGPSALEHYARRVPALEHRFLVHILQLAQVEGCTLLFALSEAPGTEVVDYYLSLLPPAVASRVAHRVQTVVVPDGCGRPLGANLLRRHDLLDRIRDVVGDRPAYIEPWNVTDNEVAVALALQLPLNGTAPSLWPLGFKSAGRKLFAAAGVPTPPGTEDVRSRADAEAAIARLRAQHPEVPAAVLKLDNSVAGDGNVVVALRDPDGSPRSAAAVAEQLAALPDWYVSELRLGAVVEAYLRGERWSSPSVQIEITPDHRARLLATHEQELGGDNGQVYLGCTFPARPDYATRLAGYGRRVGEALAARGALGMLSVDFVAVQDDGRGSWRLYGLEVNLRRGGTTTPMVVLSSLVPGRFDGRGQWRTADGSRRCYTATDNLVDPAWTGLRPGTVIDAVGSAGLGFDRRHRTGVVLHMLSGLAIDGRFGFTAFGGSLEECRELSTAVRTAVEGLRLRTPPDSPEPRLAGVLR